MKTKRNPDWTTMMAELEAFQQAYGHLRVEEHGKSYPTLAGWLPRIRARLETLTYGQILSLDNLGFFGRLDQHWLDRYAQLKAFKERAGHCKVSNSRPGNPTLAKWVHTQRREAAKMTMAPWRRKLLTDLEFRFEVAHRGVSAEWDVIIKRLARYRERFGHCHVPSTWREDRTLVHWVSRLRTIRKSLDPEIIAQLEALDFEWDPVYVRWEKRFRELEAFKAKHGHCRVTERPSVLGNWIGNLRSLKETLSEERIRRLDEIGFDWAPIDTWWSTRYEELLEFKRKHGHTNVPATWAESPELAQWVIVQRHRKTKPAPEQIALLEKAGFDWDPYETAWMRNYEELKAFRRKNGHCRPRVDTSALGKWVHKQRMNAHKMLPHRKALLNKIGFWWGEKIDDAWMRQYEGLKAYHIKHGRGPSQTELLGRWVSNQRTAHREMRIPPERKRLLDEIGFVWRVYTFPHRPRANAGRRRK